ncbi:hypothetical protein PMAYCL1PPCAC_29424 [Pristionchus mayeri]|uniref:Uncharacterized protein n=1 Tax=Pristionchus mayeri TaxID=1317129 RepID=A0AAN5DC82_9BILA|nr:hypothetical protein PMAYCL1PPCAC_29424 [Pristionchus mayeri]
MPLGSNLNCRGQTESNEGKDGSDEEEPIISQEVQLVLGEQGEGYTRQRGGQDTQSVVRRLVLHSEASNSRSDEESVSSCHTREKKDEPSEEEGFPSQGSHRHRQQKERRQTTCQRQRRLETGLVCELSPSNPGSSIGHRPEGECPCKEDVVVDERLRECLQEIVEGVRVEGTAEESTEEEVESRGRKDFTRIHRFLILSIIATLTVTPSSLLILFPFN